MTVLLGPVIVGVALEEGVKADLSTLWRRPVQVLAKDLGVQYHQKCPAVEMFEMTHRGTTLCRVVRFQEHYSVPRGSDSRNSGNPGMHLPYIVTIL